MKNDAIINELQGKALQGDNGLAVPISISHKNPALHSISLMAKGYEDEAEKRGDDLFATKPRELTEDEIKRADPAIRIAYGYGQRAEAVAEYKAKKREYRNSMTQAKENYNQATQSKTFVEMFNDNK